MRNSELKHKLNETPNGLELLGMVLISVLIAAVIAFLTRTPMRNDCVRGGYAALRRVRGQELCFGVNSDGEWHVEPLPDVQERLGER